MSGPFTFIATNRLKEGKLEDERERVPGLGGFIQENEPRLLAFNEYANEEGTEVGVVQVHRDAESMEFHMKPLPTELRARTPKRWRRPRASRSTARPARPSWRC